MQIADLTDLWPVLYTQVLEFWRLLQSPIEAAADRLGVPLTLYDYGELGLEDFSITSFQRRDPYSNPAGFLQTFADLAAAGWIEPVGEQHYHVTEHARSATREIIRAGYRALGQLDVLPVGDATRLLAFLARLVEASRSAPEPPEQWAIQHRFRAADAESPVLAQIREAVMDLFGYRDDAHLSAWKPVGLPGPACNAFTMLWRGEAVSPAQMAEHAAFRGYGADEYARALQTLLERRWAETADTPGTYRLTAGGKALREEVEQRTDAYFYWPWHGLSEGDVQEVRSLLLHVRDHLLACP